MLVNSQTSEDEKYFYFTKTVLNWVSKVMILFISQLSQLSFWRDHHQYIVIWDALWLCCELTLSINFSSLVVMISALQDFVWWVEQCHLLLILFDSFKEYLYPPNSISGLPRWDFMNFRQSVELNKIIITDLLRQKMIIVHQMVYVTLIRKWVEVVVYE